MGIDDRERAGERHLPRARRRRPPRALRRANDRRWRQRDLVDDAHRHRPHVRERDLGAFLGAAARPDSTERHLAARELGPALGVRGQRFAGGGGRRQRRHVPVGRERRRPRRRALALDGNVDRRPRHRRGPAFALGRRRAVREHPEQRPAARHGRSIQARHAARAEPALLGRGRLRRTRRRGAARRAVARGAAECGPRRGVPARLRLDARRDGGAANAGACGVGAAHRSAHVRWRSSRGRPNGHPGRRALPASRRLSSRGGGRGRRLSPVAAGGGDHRRDGRGRSRCGRGGCGPGGFGHARRGARDGRGHTTRRCRNAPRAGVERGVRLRVERARRGAVTAAADVAPPAPASKVSSSGLEGAAGVDPSLFVCSVPPA